MMTTLGGSMIRASLIGRMRSAGVFLRGTVFTVLVTFGSVLVSPTVLGAKAELQRQERMRPAELTEDQRIAQALTEVQELLSAFKQDMDEAAATARQGRKLGDQITIATAPRSFFDDDKTKQRLDQLKALRQQLLAMHDGALERFDEIERHIKEKNLPPVILERHEQAVRQYQQEMARLMGNLAAVESAESEVERQRAIEAAFEHMQGKRQKRSHQFTDPDALPFGPRKSEVREPLTTKEELQALVIEPVMLASAGGDDELLLAAMAPNPQPSPADLAETEDVRLTAAIRQLAAELDHHPVKIYNWVYNNIEFIPSYGSIQGADMTLQARRGNAFDTSSLLIALLRASGIPARYAYGTVRAPADKVMNWVGGVTVPEAAMNLMGQGGIPNKGLAQGGEIKWIQFEHVWVEAWVDMVPSRGAVQREGDSWVALDASFKQYQYTEGLELDEAVSLDMAELSQRVESAMYANDVEGWFQNRDPGLVDSYIKGYQGQLEAYVKARDVQKAGDVFGTKTIIPRTSATFSSSLPYEHVSTTAGFASLPSNMRWKFKYELRDEWGGVVFTVVDSLPRLAGKKLALSFRAASQADADLVASYLPAPHADGSPIELSELPRSLPGYLIKLIPQWTVDGVVQTSSSTSFAMGSELKRETGLWSPRDGWMTREKVVTVGVYQAIGLDLQGITSSLVDRLYGELEATEARLDEPAPTGLGSHSVVGDMMQAAVYSYFAMNDLTNQLAASAGEGVVNRMPSFGAFETALTPQYWFGVPRQVSMSGLIMDIDQSSVQLVAKNNSSEQAVKIAQVVGARASANEHAVPESMFGDEGDSSGKGISAVRALSLAAAQGQRIYRLTAANADQLRNVNIDAGARIEISNALARGLEVSVHAAPISHYGWSGSGYIIVDPNTGAGAYKISGGYNGGFLESAIAALDSMIQYLDQFETKYLDALGKFGKAVKKAINKIKRFLQNIKALFEIVQECNPGFALLGVILYLISIWVVVKITMALMTAVTVVSAACGPYAGACAFAANVFLVWTAVDALNATLEGIADYIVEGCRSMPFQ